MKVAKMQPFSPIEILPVQQAKWETIARTSNAARMRVLATANTLPALLHYDGPDRTQHDCVRFYIPSTGTATQADSLQGTIPKIL